MATYERHNRKTEATIKDALIRLLESKPLTRISVSEISSAAGISRSTFYAHFTNVREVYDSALRDFHTESVMQLQDRLRCATCAACPSRRPFCEAIRNAGRYQPLVNDPLYFPAVMELLVTENDEISILDDYRRMGLSELQAKAVAMFQLSGCYAAATSLSDEADWTEAQKVIDDFIRGGVQSLRSGGGSFHGQS